MAWPVLATEEMTPGQSADDQVEQVGEPVTVSEVVEPSSEKAPTESPTSRLSLSESLERAARQETRPKIEISHPGKGFQIQTSDELYRLHFSIRGQFRFSTPFDSDPRRASQFEADGRSSIDIRRSRLKFDGHAYRKWMKYYMEYDVGDNRLLDLRMTLSKVPWLQVRAGQYKIWFNRERVDSSGKQQFAERSIVNREFTVDRQLGAMVFGHIFVDSPGDSWYSVGVYNGTGRLGLNDDSSMMWLARYQWNFLGRDLAFSQSDVEYHEKPTGSIAIAGVTNESAFTRFSSGGGGSLDGFEVGEPGQFEINQAMEELSFKYRGFSFQQEFHLKTINDTVNLTSRDMRGNYLQAGYMIGQLSESLPDKLELAFRHAFVDPDTSFANDRREEYTLALNWFFAKHDNKLTFDFSRLTLEQGLGPKLDENRLRIQWDVSF